MKHGGPNPDKWLDRAVQEFVYGFDCVQDAEERWGAVWGEVVAEKAH